MKRPGTWWLKSEKDPRWNITGRGIVGDRVRPVECEEIIESLKQQLGKMPDDLSFGYMKD